MKSIVIYFVLTTLFTFFTKAQGVLDTNNTVRTFFGNKVVDEYAWLTDATDNMTKIWLDSQIHSTEEYFDKLPYMKRLETAIYENSKFYLTPPDNARYNFTFFSKDAAYSRRKHDYGVPVLYFRRKNDVQWEELIDPMEYQNAHDEYVVVENYSLSKDGSFLAFSLSRNGSDWVEIRVKNMNTGKDQAEILRWIKHSSLVWNDSGFFYRRFDKPQTSRELVELNGEEYLYYHRINTSQESDIMIPVKNCSLLEYINDSCLLLHTKEKINGVDFLSLSVIKAKDLANANAKAGKFISYPMRTRYNVNVLSINDDEAIVCNNFLSETGMIASFKLNKLNSFRELVPGHKELLIRAVYLDGKYHCLYKTDTCYMMVRYDSNATIERAHLFKRFSSVGDLKMESNKILTYTESSFERPPVYHKFDLETYKPSLVSHTYVNYEVGRYVTQRVEYESSDGEKIPMDLFYRKGLKINEHTPVLLSAYGGFGIVNNQNFDYSNILWADNDCMLAVAYVRGGGERGVGWHMAGRKRNKQQSITDFIYAAKFLIKSRYTSPEKLAITGSSHGGLLVAAAINQAPTLFKAAIPIAAPFDMLNYQDYTLGNYISDEFGTSQDSVDFRNLYSYSPLHNVTSFESYPATLVVTGDHDDRVPPFHSYKYIAKRKHLSVDQDICILHITANVGHGGGITLTQKANEKARRLAFLFKALEIKPKIPPKYNN